MVYKEEKNGAGYYQRLNSSTIDLISLDVTSN